MSSRKLWVDEFNVYDGILQFVFTTRLIIKVLQSRVYRDGFTFLKYRKLASCNTPHSEAHKGFFRLLMKKIFDPYVV